jgi:predicted amidohydrolase
VKRVPFRVAVVQTHPVFGEVEENVTEALTLASHALAAAGRADLVVFPELFNTGYVFVSRREALDLAEDAVRGPTARALTAFCREHGTAAVGGLCERRGDELHNSAVWVGPRGVRGVYRKVHLFAREKRWFAPGREPWPVFRVGAARVGLLICFDWRFPEAARCLALAGADLLAHPANLVQPYCQEAMRTRALENRVFCATANRVGADRRPGQTVAFTGGSQVVDPDGRVLARGSRSQTEALVVDLDLARARRKRVTEANDLWRDRVPGLYAALCRPAGLPGSKLTQPAGPRCR